MSNVWVTSDLHLMHQLVAEHRWEEHCARTWAGYGYPAPTAEQIIEWHDGQLAENWDDAIAPGDQVWVLGDLSVGGSEATAYALNWISDRPGEKILVPGNHDAVHPMHRDAHRWQKTYLQVFAAVQPFARRRIPFTGGRSFLLSHFPYVGDHTTEERYSQYRLRDEGEWLLHGHTHGVSRWAGWRHPRQIHVGVDAWGLKPVNLDSIVHLFNEIESEAGHGA